MTKRWAPGCTCCGDSATTECCLASGPLLVVPAGAVSNEDCSPIAFPYFSNLIVEVSGDLVAACSTNGSYSVPNSDTCVLSGRSVFGSCMWSQRYAAICNGGFSGDPYGAHINVLVSGGGIVAYVGIHKRTVACNQPAGFGGAADNYFERMRFELLGGSPRDLTGTLNLPPAYSNPGVWDGSDLVVYF